MRLVFISCVTAITPLRTISVSTGSARLDLGSFMPSPIGCRSCVRASNLRAVCRRRDRVRPYWRAQREGAGGLAGAIGGLQHQVAPRAIHPIKNLDAPMAGKTGQGFAPALRHLDRADRAVGAAALGTL